MTTEGRVIVTERVAEAQPQVVSDTTVAIIGTGDGLQPGVLANNEPRHYASAAAFIDAVRPDAGTPTGTLWNAARAVRDNVQDDIIVVQAAGSTSDNVDAAVDTLGSPVGDIFPDIIVAPSLNALAASAAADPVVGHLDAVAELIDAVFVVNVRASGADKATQLANAVAYAGANGRQRGILLFSRGQTGATDVDISAHYAGALARRDIEVHRGANPFELKLRGIAGTNPRLVYNAHGRGNLNDDVATLLAANIVPIVEFNGLTALGTRFSGFSATDTSPFRYIQTRRTADQIVEHVRVIARPFLRRNTGAEVTGDITSAVSQYMADLQAVGQIREYRVTPDAARNTPAAINSGNYYILISFVGTSPVTTVNLVVEAASGTLATAA